MADANPTAAELRADFSYDPDTGYLTRISGQRPGHRVGYLHKRGYVMVSYLARIYLAHRVAWCLAHGAWPAGEIDHINGDKADNRICNLRVCDASTNQQNIRAAKAGNTTGLLGVTVDRESGKFVAQISYNHRHIHLGRFDSADLAHAAYLGAKRAIHKACTL